MNCKETRKWLSPYLDSELEQTKTFEVCEHLRVCPNCAQRFEQEREAEQLMRDRINRETMPGELWQRLSREVSTPSWIAALKSRRVLSLAAVIALAVAVWQVAPANKATASQPHWLVERFEAEIPTNTPFPEVDDELTAALASIRQALNLDLQLPNGSQNAVGHSGLKIISARKRDDPQGHVYYEVRLNCCGFPTLLALIPPGPNGAPGVTGIEPSTPPKDRDNEVLYVDVRNLGSVTAVALSRHHVESLHKIIRPAQG